jgi:hypothetical protein
MKDNLRMFVYVCEGEFWDCTSHSKERADIRASYWFRCHREKDGYIAFVGNLEFSADNIMALHKRKKIKLNENED